MNINLTGVQRIRSRSVCVFSYPFNDIIFKVDFRNKLLYKTLEEMVTPHKRNIIGLYIYDKSDNKQLLECGLKHISNEILKYCLKNYIETKTKTSTKKIKNYFSQLEGYPSLNGEFGISLQKVSFYSLNFDESHFEIEDVNTWHP